MEACEEGMPWYEVQVAVIGLAECCPFSAAAHTSQRRSRVSTRTCDVTSAINNAVTSQQRVYCLKATLPRATIFCVSHI